MEGELLAIYKRFKMFLDDFLIRRAADKLTEQDFIVEKYDFISEHLQHILPVLPPNDVTRLGIYFNDVLVYQLKAKQSSKLCAIKPTGKGPEKRCLSKIRRIDSPQMTFSNQPTTSVTHLLTDQMGPGHEGDNISERFSDIDFGIVDNVPISHRPSNQERIDAERISSANESIPFLANFEHLMEGRISVGRATISRQVVPKRKRNDQQSEVVGSKRKKEMDFETICHFRKRSNTMLNSESEKEICFRYFPLATGQQNIMFPRRMETISTDSDERCQASTEKALDLLKLLRSRRITRLGQLDEVSSQLSLSALPMLRDKDVATCISSVDMSAPFCSEIDLNRYPVRSVLQEDNAMLTQHSHSELVELGNQDILTMEFNPNLPFGDVPEDNQTSIQNEGMQSFPQILPERIIDSAVTEIIPFNTSEPNMLNSLPDLAEAELPSIDLLLNEGTTPNTDVDVVRYPFGDNRVNWYQTLRQRIHVLYPESEIARKVRKRRKPRQHKVIPMPENPQQIEEPFNLEIENASLSVPLADIYCHSDHTEDSTKSYQRLDVKSYIRLLKIGGMSPDFETWMNFDPHLFHEADNFDLYLDIFKTLIKEDFVIMASFLNDQLSRCDAAKAFKFILELKAMDLLSVETIGIQISKFQLKNFDIPQEIED